MLIKKAFFISKKASIEFNKWLLQLHFSKKFLHFFSLFFCCLLCRLWRHWTTVTFASSRWRLSASSEGPWQPSNEQQHVENRSRACGGVFIVVVSVCVCEGCWPTCCAIRIFSKSLAVIWQRCIDYILRLRARGRDQKGQRSDRSMVVFVCAVVNGAESRARLLSPLFKPGQLLSTRGEQRRGEEEGIVVRTLARRDDEDAHVGLRNGQSTSCVTGAKEWVKDEECRYGHA